MRLWEDGDLAAPAGAHVRGPGDPIRALDLFAGAGGLGVGLREASARFEVVRAVEIDPAAAATHSANFEGAVFQGPIQSWLADEDVPSVDVVLGGPPCQGFSTLGKQAAEDIRNELWREYIETVRRAGPAYFVLENVPAFRDSPQFQLFHESTRPGGILADYSFAPHLLNAADYGAAQLRKRVVVIGHHRDLPDPGAPPKTHEGRHLTLRQVLKGVPPHVDEDCTSLPERSTGPLRGTMPGPYSSWELHVTRHYTEKSRDRIRCIPQGGNRTDIPWDMLPPCWRRHQSGSFDVMGRLRWDRPAVTIRTEFFKPEKGRYLHPDEDRALTHYEAARIQGFPDDFRWYGSKVAIARQIGNAVPVPLAKAIGRHLEHALDQHRGKSSGMAAALPSARQGLDVPSGEVPVPASV